MNPITLEKFDWKKYNVGGHQVVTRAGHLVALAPVLHSGPHPLRGIVLPQPLIMRSWPANGKKPGLRDLDLFLVKNPQPVVPVHTPPAGWYKVIQQAVTENSVTLRRLWHTVRTGQEAQQGCEFIVRSSHGDIYCDPMGWVKRIEPHEGGEDLTFIEAFDIQEWLNYYPGEDPSEMDILDIGYWCKDGKYEPPVEDYRDRPEAMMPPKPDRREARAMPGGRAV